MAGDNFKTIHEYTCLEITVDETIGYLRFTRPKLLNRFDEALHRELPLALAELTQLAESTISVIVISAEGSAFSAGGDLDMMARANKSAEMRSRLADEGRAIIERLIDMPVPILVAVQGAAIGLGATVISCCDIVICWRHAKIADPHVALGLVAGDGGVLGWSQSVGVLRAKRYLLTGDSMTGEDAFAIGFVTDLVDSPENALPEAAKLARKIAALPKAGVQGTKKAFSRLTRDLYFSAFERSLADEMDVLGGKEFEGVIKAIEARHTLRGS